MANSAEPWRIANPDDIPPIFVKHPAQSEGDNGFSEGDNGFSEGDNGFSEGDNGFSEGDNGFKPYRRNPETLARPWAIPGTPGLEHRLGGLAKQPGTGNVSYDPDENQEMNRQRIEKVARLADIIPPQPVYGPEQGDLLVISWGGTYGAVRSAVMRLQRQGKIVSHTHLRYLNPFPHNLGQIIGNFERILVPELNFGQLLFLLRANFPEGTYIPHSKVQGQPFKISEISQAISSLLS